jgi:hypothetical protein
MSNRKNISNQPSLRTLSFVLRHSELWPAGFEWYYGSCHTCAMGLARRLWDERVKQPTLVCMMEVFGINSRAAGQIFCSAYDRWSDITPEMVADRIDSILPTHKRLTQRNRQNPKSGAEIETSRFLQHNRG